jgi:hypothetical protein
MKKIISNYKDLMDYCIKTDTYVIERYNNKVYLKNWEYLKLNNEKLYV